MLLLWLEIPSPVHCLVNSYLSFRPRLMHHFLREAFPNFCHKQDCCYTLSHKHIPLLSIEHLCNFLCICLINVDPLDCKLHEDRNCVFVVIVHLCIPYAAYSAWRVVGAQ